MSQERRRPGMLRTQFVERAKLLAQPRRQAKRAAWLSAIFGLFFATACAQQQERPAGAEPPDAPAEHDPPAPRVTEVDGVTLGADELAARLAWESAQRGESVETFARRAPEEREVERAAERALHGLLRQQDLQTWGALPDRAARESALGEDLAWGALDEGDPRRALVGPQRAERYASEALERARWLSARLDRVDDDDRYFAWRTLNDQLTALIAIVPNDPTDRALSAMLNETPERIDAWYTERRHRYRLPPRARISWIHRAAPLDERGPDHPARRALSDALQRARAGEEFAALAAAISEHPSAQRGGRYGEVQERQFPGVFALEVGEISEVLEDARGYYIARLDARIPSELAPLDDALRRRIAREIVRETQPQPAPMEAAREIQAALADGDDGRAAAIAAEHGGRLHETPPFRRSPHDHIPFAGQSQALHARLFEEDVAGGFTLSAPLVSTQGLVALRVLSRAPTPRARFDAEREAFDAPFRALMEREAWPARLVERGAPRAEFDPEAVADALERLARVARPGAR